MTRGWRDEGINNQRSEEDTKDRCLSAYDLAGHATEHVCRDCMGQGAGVPLGNGIAIAKGVRMK